MKPTCTNVPTADPYESVFILLHLLSRLMLCLWIVCTIKENSRHCASPYLSEPYDDLTSLLFIFPRRQNVSPRLQSKFRSKRETVTLRHPKATLEQGWLYRGICSGACTREAGGDLTSNWNGLLLRAVTPLAGPCRAQSSWPPGKPSERLRCCAPYRASCTQGSRDRGAQPQ